MSHPPSLSPEPQTRFFPEGRPSFGGLFLAAAASLLLLGIAFRLDSWAVEWVRSEAHGWGKWFAGRVGFWGDWFGVVALGGVAWGFGRFRKNVRFQRTVLLMGICAAVSGLSANVVRGLGGRARPFSEAAPGWYGPARGARLAKSSHQFQAFPSAHTAVVAGFLAPMALVCARSRRPRKAFLGGLLALAGTALMAWARVWAGAHHVSDVTASSLLGLWLAFWMLKRFGHRLNSPPDRR